MLFYQLGISNRPSECGSKFPLPIVEELPKTPLTVVREISLPLPLEADIANSLILLGFVVDLSIGWFLSFKYSSTRIVLSSGLTSAEQLARLVLVSLEGGGCFISARYRSTIYYISVGGRISRAA